MTPAPHMLPSFAAFMADLQQQLTRDGKHHQYQSLIHVLKEHREGFATREESLTFIRQALRPYPQLLSTLESLFAQVTGSLNTFTPLSPPLNSHSSTAQDKITAFRFIQKARATNRSLGQSLVRILLRWNNHQISLNEMYYQVKPLFHRHPELLQEFHAFLSLENQAVLFGEPHNPPVSSPLSVLSRRVEDDEYDEEILEMHIEEDTYMSVEGRDHTPFFTDQSSSSSVFSPTRSISPLSLHYSTSDPAETLAYLSPEYYVYASGHMDNSARTVYSPFITTEPHEPLLDDCIDPNDILHIPTGMDNITTDDHYIAEPESELPINPIEGPPSSRRSIRLANSPINVSNAGSHVPERRSTRVREKTKRSMYAVSVTPFHPPRSPRRLGANRGVGSQGLGLARVDASSVADLLNDGDDGMTPSSQTA